MTEPSVGMRGYFSRRFGPDGNAASKLAQELHVALLKRENVLAALADRQDV